MNRQESKAGGRPERACQSEETVLASAKALRWGLKGRFKGQCGQIGVNGAGAVCGNRLGSTFDLISYSENLGHGTDCDSDVPRTGAQECDDWIPTLGSLQVLSEAQMRRHSREGTWRTQGPVGTSLAQKA